MPSLFTFTTFPSPMCPSASFCDRKRTSALMGPREETSARAAALVTKWSIKPANHNTTRVRNNQRRHRERIKNRIEYLEAQLAETQAELERARQTIKDLNAKVEGCSQLSHPGNPTTAAPTSTTTLHALLHEPAISLHSPETLICTNGKNSGDPPLGPLLGGTSSVNGFSGKREDQSKMRPPVVGESTTSCEEAFRMLAEQNYAKLDMLAMRSWLEPGFRRGLSDTEGCRVANSLLFALLNHISV
ncbi:hypothetical protein VHEMI09106 [[Torrubiella] hemipterigena]|uniref:BZIP domain-containing protein n=1 Tax=[Torrubiella] hemipterigena TaxID=1531966 RepID=A0A0A1TPF3_9HYPO|nr:hypothetical protein VHEMI09106 [[Torrubiella] hemipterigena]